MNHTVEENMAFFSHDHLYPSGVVPIQMSPQQGSERVFTEKPVRRRRKKARNGGEGVLKKRKLSDEQANLLEECFGNEQKLESERKDRLASELGLEPKQVAVWFQNRRARWKNKKLEEEYARLKSLHENVVVQKCQLESEVLRLKDRLCEAEKEMQRLLEEMERGGSSKSHSLSSPSSATDVAVLGGFDSESSYDHLFYVPDNSYDHLMDWFNLYM